MRTLAENLLARLAIEVSALAAAKPMARIGGDVPLPPTTPDRARKPEEKLSITAAAKRERISRDTISRLYKAGFVKGSQPSPKKILIDAAESRRPRESVDGVTRPSNRARGRWRQVAPPA